MHHSAWENTFKVIPTSIDSEYEANARRLVENLNLRLDPIEKEQMVQDVTKMALEIRQENIERKVKSLCRLSRRGRAARSSPYSGPHMATVVDMKGA